jgi:hypothetical protein
MSRLELPDDFRDVLVALADARADFVVIGGWAMAVHGRPRATEDLDVLKDLDDAEWLEHHDRQ